MKSHLTPLTKLTIAGLAACAIAIWTQAFSGDPAYPTVPPGPIIFLFVAFLIALAHRWRWTPMLGTLLSILVTAGWFARLPAEVLRLSHPAALGGFTAGIFLGTLLQIIALLVTDFAGIAATLQNYQEKQPSKDSV